MLNINIGWEFSQEHIELLGKAINGTDTITTKEFESFLKGVVDRTVLKPITTKEPSWEEKRQMKVVNMTASERQSYMNGWAQAGARFAKK